MKTANINENTSDILGKAQDILFAKYKVRMNYNDMIGHVITDPVEIVRKIEERLGLKVDMKV